MKPITLEIIPDAKVGGFTARILGIPAYGEGESEEAAIADLKEGVGAYVSAFGMDDALAHITSPAVRTLDVTLEEFSRA